MSSAGAEATGAVGVATGATGANCGAASVSYTHLDVYKRQVFIIFLSLQKIP